uniref:Uncharacterized protein n=1 Tax=Oryza barthii TaxID=65489 RepID=A0A0D3GVR9_9ORYZ
MGSCASKKMWTTASAAAVHPWSPPPAAGQLTVRMRASEFNALAAGGDIGRAILDGCIAGRWAWSSPASS